jgi:hypothetical protein
VASNANAAPGSGIAKGSLTFNRGFNTVLTIQQGFSNGT